jgi:hypothetical protein
MYGFYNANGDSVAISDTLTISTTKVNGIDSVLINKDINVSSVSVPISYTLPADVLYFDFADTTGHHTIDTVKIEKDNMPHFESVDCNPTYFHEIKRVFFSHHYIDSVVIKNKFVNYDASKKHFYIYLNTNN